MAGIRQTFDKDGKPHPKWRYWFKNWEGKRVWETGAEDPKRTQAIADSLDAQQAEIARKIRLGVIAAPTTAQQTQHRPIGDASQEYLAWGNAQGGTRGLPWSPVHANDTEHRIEYWQRELGLKTLRDLEGMLPRVEKALRRLKDSGLAGKTVQHYSMTIAAFCNWCVTRGYLDKDPLAGIAAFDTTPETRRRALLPEEVQRVLLACPPHRRLLYEVAICTGLRAGELENLRVQHLDVKCGGLTLDAAWTKSRKPGFQPLPAALVIRLQDAASNNMAARFYSQMPRKPKNKPPADALLYVPAHTARDLEKDLEKAGLTKWLDGEKADFHALRVSYDTLMFESGANGPEVQHLMRHSTIKLSVETYARVRRERLQFITEAVAGKVLPADQGDTKCATAVQQAPAASSAVNASARSVSALSSVSKKAGDGHRTRDLRLGKQNVAFFGIADWDGQDAPRSVCTRQNLGFDRSSQKPLCDRTRHKASGRDQS